MLCGSGFNQAGNHPNLECDPRAQILLSDNTATPISQCAKNALVDLNQFDCKNQLDGVKGYQQYMSWIKEQLITKRQMGINVGGEVCECEVHIIIPLLLIL